MSATEENTEITQESKEEDHQEMAAEIPEKFLGRFKLERSENFDEYLASRGVSWLFRKIICFTSITKTFEKSASSPGRYDAHNLSSKGDTAYLNWALGEEFQAKGLDGKQHKITFDLADNGDTLTERHIRLDDEGKTAQGGEQGETYRYSINEENKLVLLLNNEAITAKRFFKRI